jgi:hypothetical protein
MRWVLLTFLTLLAALAALALAQRTKPSGRAELGLTTTILWNVLVGTPIYALGLTEHLTPRSLAITAGVLSSGALAGAGWRGSLGRSARELSAGVVALATLPFDAIARAKRERSLVVLALLLIATLIVYTAFASYFTPSWRQWDTPWYHETIIGFTIQNHSFAPIDLGSDKQKVNGYPRFCEMIQLWFVIFTDRRLIELTNSLIAPGFMYATYLIARRYTRDVVTCTAWAAVAMIMPNASYLLQSSYVDLHVGLFVLAGTYYATRPVYRLVDAWLAGVCVALAIGSKFLALPPAGIVLLIALGRLILHHGLRWRTLGTALGGGLPIALMAAEVFWRNWKHFKNPLWPDLDYDNVARGIHFRGILYNGVNALDMNMKLTDLVEALLSVPYSVSGLGPKGQLYDYGFAVVWFVFPLSALTLAVVIFLCFRDVFARIARIPAWRAPEAYNPLLVALPVVAQVTLSPALWGGRYHIANVGALAAICAFIGGRRRWHVFGAGAAVSAALASLIVFVWLKPRWVWLPSELMKFAAIPYPEREVTPATAISKTIDIRSGACVAHDVGLEREKLRPGEIVVFNDSLAFPSLLWNNAFSNKLVFVEGTSDYVARADALGARWIYCKNGDPVCAPLFAASSGATPTWEDLGFLNIENWGHVYRRLAP